MRLHRLAAHDGQFVEEVHRDAHVIRDDPHLLPELELVAPGEGELPCSSYSRSSVDPGASSTCPKPPSTAGVRAERLAARVEDRPAVAAATTVAATVSAQSSSEAAPAATVFRSLNA